MCTRAHSARRVAAPPLHKCIECHVHAVVPARLPACVHVLCFVFGVLYVHGRTRRRHQRQGIGKRLVMAVLDFCAGGGSGSGSSSISRSSGSSGRIGTGNSGSGSGGDCAGNAGTRTGTASATATPLYEAVMLSTLPCMTVLVVAHG